ncbi:MAG TPA: spermidine/putrescine ABC transporter substrate-binding protein [Gammaproteobacteria bacterium]|jgi:spermidine/putrescine transport system substrate-binding protein|nr:spermidine/putrescine ABC transporter substrate-binding protein [Gammaproteobacteria bacterium]
MRFSSFFLLGIAMMFPAFASAQERIVNVYTWAGEISDDLIKQFEKQTGIKVNYSTYQSNEVMFAKLRAGSSGSYDVIMPSSYFVERMNKADMLAEIDKSKLSNWKNISAEFTNPAYDPEAKHSVPFIWGVTGIFVNDKYYNPATIRKWPNLWEARFYNQLLMLDDTREIFSMALISLGYSSNDSNPEHITQAFDKLKKLMKNVKVFSTETVISILIDEDAKVGMCWNGDAYKASRENKNIKFIFPDDGFVIWVDNLAIPKLARHKDEAYEFINFMISAESGKTTTMKMNYPVTNGAAIKLLPPEMRNNPIIYPDKSVLKRGQFPRDLGEKTLDVYEKFWEVLKMSG